MIQHAGVFVINIRKRDTEHKLYDYEHIYVVAASLESAITKVDPEFGDWELMGVSRVTERFIA